MADDPTSARKPQVCICNPLSSRDSEANNPDCPIHGKPVDYRLSKDNPGRDDEAQGCSCPPDDRLTSCPIHGKPVTAERVIKEAWELLAKLERDYCIDCESYDDADRVAEWCAKAKPFLPIHGKPKPIGAWEATEMLTKLQADTIGSGVARAAEEHWMSKPPGQYDALSKEMHTRCDGGPYHKCGEIFDAAVKSLPKRQASDLDVLKERLLAMRATVTYDQKEMAHSALAAIEQLQSRGEELGGIVEEQIIEKRDLRAKLAKAREALREIREHSRLPRTRHIDNIARAALKDIEE